MHQIYTPRRKANVQHKSHCLLSLHSVSNLYLLGESGNTLQTQVLRWSTLQTGSPKKSSLRPMLTLFCSEMKNEDPKTTSDENRSLRERRRLRDSRTDSIRFLGQEDTIHCLVPKSEVCWHPGHWQVGLGQGIAFRPGGPGYFEVVLGVFIYCHHSWPSTL